jgi:hypothetical protein
MRVFDTGLGASALHFVSPGVGEWCAHTHAYAWHQGSEFPLPGSVPVHRPKKKEAWSKTTQAVISNAPHWTERALERRQDWEKLALAWPRADEAKKRQA